MFTSERTKIILLIISFICFGACVALAQGPGFPSAPTDTPIDGGATLVAIAAAGYGIKKLREQKNSNK